MNAFSLILLSICGIILYGNCLPYREFWSKYKSRDDYYEDYYLKKVPKMKISPQKVKEFLINHLSWFPLDDSQDQRKGSSTQKTYDKRHEITAKPHITHIRKNVTVVHRVHQVTIKEKLTEKFKNFTKDHNMQPNWTAIKNKSTLSLLKLKYFIKQQHFKEKFKNATHPLRYKGTKTRKKNKNKHRGKNGSQCACPTALAHSKGPPVQPVKISTTFLPPPPDFWQIPKIPTELPQSLKEKYSSEKPQIWHTKEDTKMTEIPEFKQKHLTVSAFQIPLGTSPKHPEFSKCVKKPSKSMAIIKFIELTLPKESTEPTNQTEYNKCREPTHVIEPIRPTECTQPMRLAMHTQHARPTPPTQFTIHQKLPEDSIPKHPEMPDPDEFPKYLQPFKNSQTPSVFSQPFNQMAKSVRLKNPHISHVKPQYYNQQKKNSQLPKLIEASPIYIKTSNSKDSLQLPNIIVLPNVPSARFVSPDKIKILIDLKTPKNAKGKKVGRSVNRESSLASLEGDNTNSTHVLETAGEMASDLAGRVTNLWHCVLGSHRIPDTRDVKFFLYTRWVCVCVSFAYSFSPLPPPRSHNSRIR